MTTITKWRGGNVTCFMVTKKLLDGLLVVEYLNLNEYKLSFRKKFILPNRGDYYIKMGDRRYY